jgi:hypothetical protein
MNKPNKAPLTGPDRTLYATASGEGDSDERPVAAGISTSALRQKEAPAATPVGRMQVPEGDKRMPVRTATFHSGRVPTFADALTA